MYNVEKEVYNLITKNIKQITVFRVISRILTIK